MMNEGKTMRRATHRLNRRQRKKKHVGEFQEFCFVVEARFRSSPDWPALHAMLDEFIDVAIEGQDLVFGGGVAEAFHGVVSSGVRYAPLGECHRASVGAWLENQALLEDVIVGPLIDAWTDSD
ncbi:50S ribosome-binding protein YggL [Massilia sp. DJPM01]|uniref:YggL 50S ribosome-binding family protein n=1 Tax=Massilia sp. DJPM01 TaxID=3024404 RepID=UPI00259EBE49|nr:50S ribosome-binding protein YggL [Massilia sp. DJPM01]MDM5179523.1 50S ribosome-binding protein YggL [Massilia sp. DJPM01]